MIARLSLSVLLLAAAIAQAQYTNPASGRQFNNIYAANADRIMSQMIQNAGYASMRASIEATVKKDAAKAPPAKAAAPAKPPAGKLPMTASDFVPAGKREVPEQLAAGIADPIEKAKTVAAGRDILKMIEGSPGFRKNNVASGMTVLLVVSIQVLKNGPVSDPESDALMVGLNDQLGATAAFKSLSAEQRTKMYDTFIVVGGFIAGTAQNAMEKKDPALMKLAQDMARDALKQFGVKA